MPGTWESSVGETKYVNKDSDKGETKVDKVVEIFIKSRLYYDI